MIDASALRQREAIDVHVHVHAGRAAPAGHDADDEIRQAARHYFKAGRADASLPGIASYYRERNLGCVVFTVDAETVDGRVPVPNEEVAEFAGEHADVMIPFASVDPWKGEVARRSLRRLIDRHGMRGLKLHPSTQAFYPNDRRFYPLYQIVADAGLPIVFHTGQTGIGAGMPGGAGIRLKYSNPLYLDDVAVDFPDLRVIMAHPSVPWQDEGLAVALHKPNVYVDLSGWSPKYFEPKLVTYIRRMLSDKVLFGSDYPVITPDRWRRDFDELGLDDDVRRKVLRDNAVDLLGLEG